MMPYNYLLSELARKNMGLRLKNNVIIVDEGHNISSAAEDVIELDLRTTDLRDIVSNEIMPFLKLIDFRGYQEEVSYMRPKMPELADLCQARVANEDF